MIIVNTFVVCCVRDLKKIINNVLVFCGLAIHYIQVLPREVDPVVFKMLSEDPGEVSYSSIGGLNEQIRDLREVSIPVNSIQCLHLLDICWSFFFGNLRQ